MNVKKIFINKRNLLIGGVAIATLITLTGCGKKKEETKTYDKENVAIVTNQTEEKNTSLVIENNTNNIAENNTNTTNVGNNTVADFTKDDLKVNGVTFGDSSEDAVRVFGGEFVSKQYEEGIDGDPYTEMSYGDGKLIFYVKTFGEDGIITSIKVGKNSTIKTTRGISIGSTREDILKAYKSESILENEEEYVIVGFPGDKEIYTSEGRIYFEINNDKVKSFHYTNVYAE